MATKPSIKRNITTRNRTKGNSGRKWIVIHNVGTAPTSKGAAKANTVYFKNTYRGASAHFFVDVAEIWQCVELSDTAWHCGTNGKYYSSCRNSTSIGIELCGNAKFPDAEINLAAKLVQWLMDEYDIDESHVIRHYDVTHKKCPAGYINSSDWKTLKNRLVKKTDKSAVVQLYQGNATDAQRWKVSRDKDGYVTLTSKSCGLALDVKGAGTKSGTVVQAYTPNGSDAQKWKVVQYSDHDYTPASAAPYMIIPKVNEKLRLDIKGAADANGTVVQIYNANNTAAQKFDILDHGDGTWTLICLDSSKAIDVKGGGK